MFSRAEMMFETSFQNDVVSLRTQTQKRNDNFLSKIVVSFLEERMGFEPTVRD